MTYARRLNDFTCQYDRERYRDSDLFQLEYPVRQLSFFSLTYLDITPTCPGGSCVAESTHVGAPPGNFGLSIGGNYFPSNVSDGLPASLVGTSLYYELLALFPAGSSRSIAMTNPTGGPYLLQGTVARKK